MSINYTSPGGEVEHYLISDDKHWALKIYKYLTLQQGGEPITPQNWNSLCKQYIN